MGGSRIKFLEKDKDGIMYKVLKRKYEMGYITKDTLKGWVKSEKKLAGRGITEQQYEEITKEKYTE